MRLAFFAAVLMMAAPAFAHHSFAAEYDGEKPITLKGVVTKVEWENPHMHFLLDVTDEKGKVEEWKFEGFPPNMLVRQGWKRDVTLKVGDTVTVFAWKARNGLNQAHSREITLADGKKIFSGPPAGTGGAN
jgi:Family of unknown function (DUF6152)